MEPQSGSLIDPPRICSECGEKGVIWAGEDDYRILICVYCFNRFNEDDGFMTAIRGPRDQQPLPDHPSFPKINPKSDWDMRKYWERRSDHAAESAAQHYIDRMIFMAQYYDTNHTPPMFTPPELWMLGMGDPIPQGTPHPVLRSARLSELFDPRASGKLPEDGGGISDLG